MQDEPMRRVVLIGAIGFFGRRLADRLATTPQIALVVTSRDEARARQAAEAILVSHASASVISLAFERDGPESLERLRALSPWLVIDASGPFQSADYRLARAVLDMGAHWIDLADALDYLLEFEATLDGFARSRGLVARAGASSTPALSDAVVASLTRGWRRIDTVDIAITPGGAGDVGEAVIGAILSYAGSPVAIFSEGQPAATYGWGSVRRSRIDGLGVRYLSPVETADADLLPARFAITSRVAFYAGLESRVEQFGLLCLAKLRQIGVAGDLRRLAPLLRSARKLTSVTASDRGGMTVDCAGLDGDGRQICAQWKLIAEQGTGPNVPILPALALVRALLKGEVTSGAGPAVGILPLDAIEAECFRRRCAHRVRVASTIKVRVYSPKRAERTLIARCRVRCVPSTTTTAFRFGPGKPTSMFRTISWRDASGSRSAFLLPDVTFRSPSVSTGAQGGRLGRETSQGSVSHHA